MQRPTTLPSTLSACILTSCGLPCKLRRRLTWCPKVHTTPASGDHEATITAKLTTGIRDAVQAYLDGCVSTLLKYMGRQGNLDPWLAQVSSWAMGFQSRILMQTAEYAGLPMELRSATVMQQLEMFIATARMLSPNLPALLSCSDSTRPSYRGERTRRAGPEGGGRGAWCGQGQKPLRC